MGAKKGSEFGACIKCYDNAARITSGDTGASVSCGFLTFYRKIVGLD